MVTESKSKRGAESAEEEVEGVMLPSGTWWRTRDPGRYQYVLRLSKGHIGEEATFFMMKARKEDGFDCARRHRIKGGRVLAV